MPFAHRKKRNGGLVYEFLVRQLGRCLIEQDQRGYAQTIGVIKRYYSGGTPLSREREFFNVIRGTRGISEPNARKILGIVRDGYGRMDHRKIEIKKSNLIKDINHSFGQGFYSKHRVPEYRLLASIQMFLDSCRPSRTLSESVQGVELEEALVRYMVTPPPAPVKADDRQVDQLVFSVASRRFQEQYGKSLSPAQKRILEGYMRSLVDGSGNFKNDLITEKKRITENLEIASHTKYFMEDPVMMERLAEARRGLMSLDLVNSTESAVQEMMLFEKLDEEIASDE